MLSFLRYAAAVFSCGAFMLVLTGNAGAQENRRPAVGSQLVQEAEQRILAKLQDSGDWEFVDVPLEDVLDAISQRLKIQIKLDHPALAEFGIGTDTPISFSVSGIPIRSSLNLMLSQIDLAWTLRDGVLWISTTEELESELITKAYPVGDLTAGVDAESFDYDTLIEVITSTVEPDSWDTIGGPGTIQGIYGSLVVSQVRDVHETVERLLSGLRLIRKQVKNDPKAVPGPVMLGGVGNPKIRAALSKPTTVEFHEVQLNEGVDHLSEIHGIPMLLDTPALEDYGIGYDTPITLKRMQDLPLSSVLRFILKDLDLTFIVRHDALMVTTVEDAERSLQICLYPVGDLVGPLATQTVDPDCLKGDCEFDDLISTITAAIEPDSWDSLGGPGSIGVVLTPPVLPIAQTEDVHSAVASLLQELRRVRATERKRQQGTE